MSIERKIVCDVVGCDASYISVREVDGFPSWGSVKGFVDLESGEDTMYVCPRHLAMIKKIVIEKLEV
jgi:hypothetical protein